jgi:hypothetical protein
VGHYEHEFAKTRVVVRHSDLSCKHRQELVIRRSGVQIPEAAPISYLFDVQLNQTCVTWAVVLPLLAGGQQVWSQATDDPMGEQR